MREDGIESKLGLHPAAPQGMRRLRLTVAYCGSGWRGWQSLAGGGTIQDELTAAVKKATRIETVVHGSGRTDAGVHALAQVAHMDVPASARMSHGAWCKALNACLPMTIRVTRVEDAEPGFHARFDAVGKIYRYRIWRPEMLDPFEADRAWHVYGRLDISALRRCADLLAGRHNFVRLSANRGDMWETQRRALPEKTTRTLHRVDIAEKGDVLEIEFEGDGFLYRMARLITGSMVQVARGRATEEWFASLLATHEGLQSNQMAPACGLYLVSVKYAGDLRH
ncbi:MAG TPA: tRNA pseudouridine(38-40) synthase TruA [Verrucomicrobiales bacterium]|nr:tRNA pseudouridine(38-40) synthase TruA [Verrucomicrobiales bacterium]HRJ08958.1 tRNA pseudouridine(38-40) synthase TruA [Prosthecobacter sp.]HRK15510.1 tRNA pseudouridine(38-40) synthase TruA [Prosthecobacter sp.]